MTNVTDVQTSVIPSVSTLLPCPCCGNKAEVWERVWWGTLKPTVKCTGCRLELRGVFDTEAEAIEAWNTRAARTCHVVKASRKYVLSDGTELFEDGCSECNGYLDDGDNYCPNCGAKVVEE